MIEKVILSGLIFNEDFTRKVIPFLKSEYFDDPSERLIFEKVRDFIDEYNGLPNKESLKVSIHELENINDDQYKNILSTINDLSYDEKTDVDWLCDKTEKFCQDKAVYNAVRESISVLDGKHKTKDKGSIPQLLTDALGVSFDTNIGHDFLIDTDDRYRFYHTKEDKIPFDLDLMNKISKGGVSRKTLSIALAGTGVGKTLFMTHCAAANLMNGYNVLYITMEMAEEKIAERIDANLLDVTVDELKDMPKDVYDKKIQRVQGKTNSKLIIKEYPTASAGSAHFRHLINELRLKKNFHPDILYIDYLNICMSSRIRMGSNVNSYTLIKAIAEELRGLAVENNIPIVSATQTTRSGYSNSDLDLSDTSESFGLPATADFMFGLISTEELELLGQIMIKQLKNRWGDPNQLKRFVVGIDRSKMRLYDVEDSAQTLVNDAPVFSDSEVRTDQFSVTRKKAKSFEGFK